MNAQALDLQPRINMRRLSLFGMELGCLWMPTASGVLRLASYLGLLIMLRCPTARDTAGRCHVSCSGASVERNIPWRDTPCRVLPDCLLNKPHDPPKAGSLSQYT